MTQRATAHRTSAGRVIAGVFSNYAGFAVRLAATLVTTPLFIKGLGTGRYGSWVLLWSISSYMTVLDVGLGLSVRKFVARAIATGDLPERDEKFSACLSVYLYMSGLVLVAGLPFVALMGKAVELDPSTTPLLWKIGVFLVLDVAVGFPINAYQGLLTAYQRYEITNTIRVGMEVIRNLALAGLAMMGASLVALAAVQFLTTLITCALIIRAATRVARPLQVLLFKLRANVVREIVAFTGWVAISNMTGWITAISASFIVGLYSPAAVVAEFYVAYRLVTFLVTLPGLMTAVLLPLASEREAQGDWPSLRRVFLMGSNANALLMVPAVVGAAFLGGAFFHAWLGSGFDRAHVYLLLLLLPMLFAQGTASSIALGSGWQKNISAWSVTTALLTFGSALIAGKFYGAMGVCIAYCVVGVVSSAVLFFVSCRWFRMPPLRSLLEIWIGPILAGSFQVAVTALSLAIVPDQGSRLGFVVRAAMSGCCYLAAAALLYRVRPGTFSAFGKLRAVIAPRLPGRWRGRPVSASAGTEIE